MTIYGRASHHWPQAVREEATQGEGGVELNAFILSHVFWPTFREEKLKLPDFIQK